MTLLWHFTKGGLDTSWGIIHIGSHELVRNCSRPSPSGVISRQQAEENSIENLKFQLIVISLCKPAVCGVAKCFRKV
jgi:hypothetical protein